VKATEFFGGDGGKERVHRAGRAEVGVGGGFWGKLGGQNVVGGGVGEDGRRWNR